MVESLPDILFLCLWSYLPVGIQFLCLEDIHDKFFFCYLIGAEVADKMGDVTQIYTVNILIPVGV